MAPGDRGDVLRAGIIGLAPADRRGRLVAPGCASIVLSFHGLDELIHADTMLFILGLTFFVSVIAQTRMLEGVTFFLLRRNAGAILPTVIAVTAVVAFASGILDGVSMIGLTIRTLVIILMLAAAPKRRHSAGRHDLHDRDDGLRRVAGVRRAAEPDHEGQSRSAPRRDVFPPVLRADRASSTYFVVARHLRKELDGQRINLETMDVIDANAEDVRFLQAIAARRSPDAGRAGRGARAGSRRQGAGRSSSGCSRAPRSGRALVDARSAAGKRASCCSVTTSARSWPTSLDRHYVLDSMGDDEGAMRAEQWVDDTLAASAQARRRAQLYGALALIPFVVLLDRARHQSRGAAVPRLVRRLCGARSSASRSIPKMRDLALREARPRIRRVLLPVSAVPVDHAADTGRLLRRHGGAHPPRHRHARALARSRGSQFIGRHVSLRDSRQQHRGRLRVARARRTSTSRCCTCSRWRRSRDMRLAAAGRTSDRAQSVVAYAFIQRDVDAGYTPLQWIREMTPVILEMLALITIVIAIESWLL